jgi:hypothetical protein
MTATNVQSRNDLCIAGQWVGAYGGFKSSGIERELGGIEGILGFTEVRAIGL